jgi:hypothetical protein
MFGYFMNALEEKGHGINGCRQSVALACQAAVNHPDAAAAHYLLSTLAEDFIDRHERMPVSAADLQTTFVKFSKAVAVLEAAFATEEPKAIWTALNTVATIRLSQN